MDKIVYENNDFALRGLESGRFLIMCGNLQNPHIEDVPGYAGVLIHKETEKEYPVWITKNCGCWDATDPWTGFAINRAPHRTRKNVIQSLVDTLAVHYTTFIDKKYAALMSDTDELSNRYYELRRAFEAERGEMKTGAPRNWNLCNVIFSERKGNK